MPWLQTDEAEDVICSIEHCSLCLDLVAESPGHWKWAIVALQNALQGAMVCHLAGTANLGHLRANSATEWLNWYASGRVGKVPTDWMADPQTLLERVAGQKPRIEHGSGSVLAITDDEISAFKGLNGLRKQFAHFNPMGWSIQLDGLPQIFGLCASIIEKTSQDPWPFRHLSDDRRVKLNEAIASLKKQIESHQP